MIDFFINLSPIYQALIAGIFTWSVTLLGAAVVIFFKKTNDTFMDSMLGFSAGVMIAASFFSLIEPAIEMAESLHSLYLSDLLFNYIDRRREANTTDRKKRCIMLITSITIHNIPEGLVMGVGFGSLVYNITGSSLMSALTLALGIGIQNFPEGCAVSLPLRREGYSRFKAFFIGQLSAIVEPICAVLGAILVIKIKFILPYLLAMAAGAMFYVAVGDLIPESQKNKNRTLMTIVTLIGFTIMMLLDVGLG